VSPAGTRRCLALKKYALNATVLVSNSSPKRFRKVRWAQVTPFTLYSLSLFPIRMFHHLCLSRSPPPLDPLPSTLCAPSFSPPCPYSRCHHQLPINRFCLSPKVPLFSALFMPPPPSLALCTRRPPFTLEQEVCIDSFSIP
jgi:hypothetical protein